MHHSRLKCQLVLFTTGSKIFSRYILLLFPETRPQGQLYQQFPNLSGSTPLPLPRVGRDSRHTEPVSRQRERGAPALDQGPGREHARVEVVSSCSPRFSRAAPWIPAKNYDGFFHDDACLIPRHRQTEVLLYDRTAQSDEETTKRALFYSWHFFFNHM
ncbi:hypothetical protein CDAR_464121 [Caerostris darwini]|uniref:Uncharacterized protein n=1 Tax=Caerostris darwini TaxID=1538125 RepID=A0AAV4VW54_9ARAC|nr:hypothetical protein CDAR_464121 [Caerostris darwini]